MSINNFFSVVWMSIQKLNLPKCGGICKAGQLGGRGRKQWTMIPDLRLISR